MIKFKYLLILTAACMLTAASCEKPEPSTPDQGKPNPEQPEPEQPEPGKSDFTLISEQMADLGLSVKWAGWNIGASKPEEYGDYYAWGEVEVRDESTYKYNMWDHYRFGWAGKNPHHKVLHEPGERYRRPEYHP